MYSFLFSKEEINTFTKQALLNIDVIELSSMVWAMIESYDNKKDIVPSVPENKYYRYSYDEAFLRRYEKTFCSIETIVNTMFPIEKEEWLKKNSDSKHLWDFLFDNITDDDIRNRIREYVIDEFIRYISDISHSVIERRKKYRLEIGSKISFTDGINTQKTDRGYIWFYKEGGWGLANSNSEVIISNHLSCIPVARFQLEDTCCIVGVSKDVDSNLYGVINLKNYQEIIPFKYNNITYIKYELSFLLVNIGGTYGTSSHNKGQFEGGKWGVYNLDGKKIIDVKYTGIESRGKYTNYFECRDEEYKYIYNESQEDYVCIYDGKYDLYDTNGILLIEGGSFVDIDRYISVHDCDCQPSDKVTKLPF